MGYWAALALLVAKNARLVARRPGSLIVIIVGCVSSMIVLWLLQASFERGDGFNGSTARNLRPTPFSLDKVPRCIPFAYQDCITLAYVPAWNENVTEWVQAVASKSGIPDREIKGFDESADLNAYLAANPNRTQAAYIFETYNIDQIENGSVSFIVQYNTTAQKDFPVSHSRFNTDVVVPSMIHSMNKILRSAVFSASLTNLTNFTNLTVDIELKGSVFPHPHMPSGDDAFVQYAPLLFFSVYFMVLVLLLTNMTEEKDKGLREAMRLSGMSQSQHFISWGFTMLTLLTAVTLLLIGLGYAFRFQFFTNIDVSVIFLTLFSFSIGISGWTFLLSTFLMKTPMVSILSFSLFLLMTLIGIFSTIVYIDGPNDKSLLAHSSFYWRPIFATLPSTMLVRTVFALALAASRGLHITFQMAMGFPRTYPMQTCWIWMVGSGAVTFALSIYFDNVLPTGHGAPLSPIYFLLPSYWKSVLWPTKPTAAPVPAGKQFSVREPDAADYPELDSDNSSSSSSCSDNPELEEDVSVQRERLCIARGDRDKDTLVIKNLVRCFNKTNAVDDVSLSVSHGRAFALLGHNGAGKSTLFKMLATSIGATSGDAFVCGRSVDSHQSEVRQVLGVCQQHDALWDLLTAAEHIRLFAALKGYDRIARDLEVRSRLMDVGLLDCAHRQSGSFSGGMQRRLSVAIALTGDPRVLLLDEFTTGADPLVRRDLWAAIERAKRDRAVLVITHDMAEAQRLGDSIGIMAQGKLRVLGSSVLLKNKFGSGYSVNVNLSARVESVLEKEIVEVCPKVRLVRIAPMYNCERSFLAQFALPISTPSATILEVVQVLEKRKEQLGILDFSLSSASLEQVFKSVSVAAGGEKDLIDPEYSWRNFKRESHFGNETKRRSSTLRRSLRPIQRHLGSGKIRML